ASTDNWFRPVYLCLGPDGALYLADFYREIIETPLSLPDDIKKRWNLNSRGKGRIWRIRAEGKYTAPFAGGKTLADASQAELIAQLENKNRWWRITAQRLLVERRDDPSGGLAGVIRQSDSTLAVVHALWTLRGVEERRLSAQHSRTPTRDV